MTLASLMTRTVVVQRSQPVVLDVYGNEQPRVFLADPPTVGYLEQLSADEQLVGATTDGSTHLCVLPALTPVEAHDRVTVDGVTFEVIGPASRPHHPRTGLGEHHVELRLRLVEG